jgi:hypothetical protein
LTNEFIPGTYSGIVGDTCTAGVSAASGGRTAGALSCKNADNEVIFNANWVTGPIAGHPFESELRAAGIDENTGAENVAWGQSSSVNNSGYCGQLNGAIISAHQAGNVLAVNNFGGDNQIDCSYSFPLVQQ